MLAIQTLVEYGAINSIISGVAATWNRVEYAIGADNVKYLLILVLVIVILLLMPRRRRI